ncbi:MAG: Formamidopyrimidine-DNA glycosylase [Parcubacteria group bacterium GW2011_GWA2_47_16]|nr:MAG: Formamidopyrimidine-DNA glycosylase [Parcubacteria group bacterium GW2011_GWA2_47_16]
MPELPEVHTTATMLHKLIKGLRIVSVWTDYDSAYHKGKDNIKDPKFFKSFARKISGGRFTKIHRRGKNVLLELDNSETVLIHMKMTGHLLYGTYSKVKSVKSKVKREEWAAEEKGPLGDFRNQFIHFVISLSDGKHLVLSDMRKFAKVTLVSTAELETSEHLGNIGPEPLEPTFTFEKFHERLMTKPCGKIKQVLMNPEVVAGVGNIYSDEMLWLADIHPLSTIASLPRKVLQGLFGAMKEILKKGIDFGGDSTSDYRNPLGEFGKFHYHHQAYRNTGNPCGKRGCKGIIRRLRLGGRSAHFCDIHQNLYENTN